MRDRDVRLGNGHRPVIVPANMSPCSAASATPCAYACMRRCSLTLDLDMSVFAINCQSASVRL